MRSLQADLKTDRCHRQILNGELSVILSYMDEDG